MPLLLQLPGLCSNQPTLQQGAACGMDNKGIEPGVNVEDPDMANTVDDGRLLITEE